MKLKVAKPGSKASIVSRTLGPVAGEVVYRIVRQLADRKPPPATAASTRTRYSTDRAFDITADSNARDGMNHARRDWGILDDAISSNPAFEIRCWACHPLDRLASR